MIEIFRRRRNPKKIIQAIIIGLAIVGFWRGTWNLMDYYILHDNLILSSWITLLAGIILLIIERKAIREFI